MGRAVVVAVFSMTCTVCGAVAIKLCQFDVYIPGCPPTPAATIYGFAMALGLLDQKLKGKQEIADPNAEAKLRFPNIPLDLRVELEREARRLAGYRQGWRHC